MSLKFSSPESDASKERLMFATTRWSLVLAAGGADDGMATEALEKLSRSYWPPLYFYVRRRGHTPADAQDLTQEFFCRLLARGDIAVARPEKGRFRSYLLGAMKHFLSDEKDKAGAAKRGGGAIIFSLDSDDLEARYANDFASVEPADRGFDRHWATAILDNALVRLRTEFAGAGREMMFDALKPYLSASPGTGDYQAIASRLEMSPGAIAVAVHRLRQRYADLVRAEIADTVASPSDVEAELRELFLALGGG